MLLGVVGVAEVGLLAGLNARPRRWQISLRQEAVLRRLDALLQRDGQGERRDVERRPFRRTGREEQSDSVGKERTVCSISSAWLFGLVSLERSISVPSSSSSALLSWALAAAAAAAAFRALRRCPSGGALVALRESGRVSSFAFDS